MIVTLGPLLSILMHRATERIEENISPNASMAAVPGTPLLNRGKQPLLGRRQPVSTPRGRTRSGRKSNNRPAYIAGTVSPRVSSAKKSKRIRCVDCRKKLNITNTFVCRCGNNYCAKHRHPEFHGCTFDYKADGRKHLEQANPILVIPKLPKI